MDNIQRLISKQAFMASEYLNEMAAVSCGHELQTHLMNEKTCFQRDQRNL